jgi:hypothetical protein
MNYDDDETRQSFFDAIAEGDETRCRTLWLSVILQQILDAKGKFGNTVTQAQARVWLEGREGSRSGLAEVCHLAGVDFEMTRARCAEILADHAAVIDFRMMKRDKEGNQTIQNRRRYIRRAEKRAQFRRVVKSKQDKGFIVPKASNDNHQENANDNLPENSNDNFIIRSTKGETHE